MAMVRGKRIQGGDSRAQGGDGVCEEEEMAAALRNDLGFGPSPLFIAILVKGTLNGPQHLARNFGVH
jgi:hypothetical protein